MSAEAMKSVYVIELPSITMQTDILPVLYQQEGQKALVQHIPPVQFNHHPDVHEDLTTSVQIQSPGHQTQYERNPDISISPTAEPIHGANINLHCDPYSNILNYLVTPEHHDSTALPVHYNQHPDKTNDLITFETVALGSPTSQVNEDKTAEAMSASSISGSGSKGSEANLYRFSLHDVALVIAGFVIQMFPQGLGNSYGVVYTDLMSRGHYTDVQMSWIGSLMTGMLGVGAMIASCLIDPVGFRLISLVGGLLTSLGFVISSLTTNIYLLYLSLGVMPGLGTALSQMAAVVCISRHFDKGRPLAVGVMATGGAVGMLTFPLLWSLVLEALGWKGAMLLFGGVSLNVIWSSWLLKPSLVNKEERKNSTKKTKPSFQVYTAFLRKSTLILFALSCVFSGLCMFIYGAYVPEYATIVLPEVTSPEIAILVCAMGAGSFIGRILFGSLSMTSSKAPLILFIIALTLCGVDDILVPVCRNYVTLIFNSTCQGLFLGGWTTIISLVAVNLFGADSLSVTLGLGYLFQGFGCVAGPPIASLLVDLTGRIDVLFYFAGSSYIISAMFMISLLKAKGHPYKNMTSEIKITKGEITGNVNTGFVAGG